MGKQIHVYSYNGQQLGKKKEWLADTIPWVILIDIIVSKERKNTSVLFHIHEVLEQAKLIFGGKKRLPMGHGNIDWERVWENFLG